MFSWHLAAEAADVIIITIMVLIIMTHFSARLIIMAAAVIMITIIMAAGKIFMQAQFPDCASFFVMRRGKERLDKSGDFHIIIIGN